MALVLGRGRDDYSSVVRKNEGNTEVRNRVHETMADTGGTDRVDGVIMRLVSNETLVFPPVRIVYKIYGAKS